MDELAPHSDLLSRSLQHNRVQLARLNADALVMRRDMNVGLKNFLLTMVYMFSDLTLVGNYYHVYLEQSQK